MYSTWLLMAVLQLGCAGFQAVGSTGTLPASPHLRFVNAGAPEVEDPQVKGTDLRMERDALQRKTDDLQRQLETAEQEIAGSKKSLADVTARLGVLEKEKGHLAASLSEARDQARELAAKLAAEQVKSATLREDKQKLMSGTTTAKEEIARLQKRAGELESEMARVDDLTKRLAQRDQDIERLRKAAGERETLASKVAALTDKLERAKQRVAALTDELAGRPRSEREPVSEGRGQSESLKAEDLQATASRMPETVQDKELVLRLAAAQAELARWFEGDVAKGDVALQYERGVLTISLADRILFENGQRIVRPDGRKALKKVGEIIRGLPDRQVRVGGRIEDPVNGTKPGPAVKGWELSTARAATVARLLMDDGGLNASELSVELSADARNIWPGLDDPRIDIVLSPKN